jgi:Cft2 family RNA processing exonuclease
MQFNFTNFLEIKKDSKKINIDQTRVCNLDAFSFITHAHSDHVCNTPQKTFATKETIDLLNLSIKNSRFDFFELEYDKKIKITENLILETLNAGHILGSSMFYFQDLKNGKDILYTGDFNRHSTLLLKGAKPITADILFLETTFGKPEFIFKNRNSIYYSLAKKIKNELLENKLIILAGYSLGKNQEIICFVNNFLDVTPLVDRKTYDFSKVYNQNGYNLKFELLDHNFSLSNILILPLSLINRDLLNSLRLQSGKNICSYVMTGWNYSRSSNLINISDHCDHNSLLDFVDEVNPKVVYTMHGFSKSFAKSITTRLGINAYPINILREKGL